MTQTGGCYCGALRYEVTGKPMLKGQCHCRECQYISGGAPQYYTALAGDTFRFTAGVPRTFQHPDLEAAVARAFCEDCGTHILTRRPDFEGVLLKIGTLDDPASFGAPKIAIFIKDAQPFHHLPSDIPHFDGLPSW